MIKFIINKHEFNLKHVTSIHLLGSMTTHKSNIVLLYWVVKILDTLHLMVGKK